MDINDIRGLVTIMMLIVFIGICWWAFAPKRKQRFEEAANLPFADEDERKHQKSTSASDSGRE